MMYYHAFDIDPDTFELLGVEAYPIEVDPQGCIEGCHRRPDLDSKVSVHGNLEVWEFLGVHEEPSFFAVVS